MNDEYFEKMWEAFYWRSTDFAASEGQFIEILRQVTKDAVKECKPTDELELELADRYMRLPESNSIQMLFYRYVERKSYEKQMKQEELES